MALIDFVCCNCGENSSTEKGAYNRAIRSGKKLFCGKKCSGEGRRKNKTKEQKVLEKAEYDKRYREKNRAELKIKKADSYQRNRDPEKERIKRKENMHKHIEYCRNPEYKQKKSEYDKRKRLEEYGYFAECKALLMELEKEISSRATRYEIYKANGRFTRSAKERRRSLCQSKKI